MDQGPASSVSVVMPCYNGLPYLPQALDSAMAQTHRPVEIVVVDDGSKDDSAACVRAYALKHPDANLRLIQQANAGEPAARNTGIRAAVGEWVAMLDTDDWWDPRKLELQVQAAQEAGPDCVLVHTGFIRHFPDGKVVPWDMTGSARRVGWCTERLLEPASIGHPSIMVRRAALEKIGGYDPSFRQSCDIDLYFRLSAVGTFAFVPRHLLHYRMHAKQMSASQIDQIPFHHRAIRQFFAAHPEIERKVGKQRVHAALVEHVELKIESLYWRRRLDDFRKLLDYAKHNGLDSAKIRGWRRRARWPNWAIHFKDRLTAPARGAGEGNTQT
jgi:glycosyltransferase involved in cell wall biosynthesis